MNEHYNLHPFAAFGRLSLPWKLGTIAGIVLCAALLTWGISAYHARAYDTAQAKAEAEKAQLRQERDAQITRANEAETKALVSEAKDKQLDPLIEQKSGQLKAEEARLEKQLDEIKRDAGSCEAINDPLLHRRCVCDKLARAGFPCQ